MLEDAKEVAAWVLLRARRRGRIQGRQEGVLHRIFGLDSQTGVTTTLLDQTTIEEVAHPTTVPRLSVIGAGPIPPNPAELFHSERFKVLLDDLLARYDRVIIDSPPVVAVTVEALALEGFPFQSFDLSEQLVHGQILAAKNSGQNSADLEDNRDHLVDELASRIDIQLVADSDGRYMVRSAGGTLVEGAVWQLLGRLC